MSSEEVSTVPEAAPRRRPTVVGGLVRAVRPRQWLKNVLVFAAPFTAARITDFGVLGSALLAFVVFSLAASSIYLINDAKDVESDREHPTKRNRPIAAGVVPVPLAYATAGLLVVGALALSYLANWQLVTIVVVYLVVQLGYCFGLKHQPVLELCIVASGFLMRFIAGGVAADIVPSQWFLLVTAFGSLFIVAGKRYAEIKLFHTTGANIRHSLRNYSESYLRFVWATAAAVMIMSYGLWAFQISERTLNQWSVISMIPLVVGMLRYAVDVDSGKAGAPEDVAFHDHVLQALGLCWLVTIGLAYYL